MAADDIATNGAMALVAMVLTSSSWNISAPALEGFPWHWWCLGHFAVSSRRIMAVMLVVFWTHSFHTKKARPTHCHCRAICNMASLYITIYIMISVMTCLSDHRYCPKICPLTQITRNRCFDVDVFDALMAGVYMELSALAVVCYRATCFTRQHLYQICMYISYINMYIIYIYWYFHTRYQGGGCNYFLRVKTIDVFQ